ncbi:MAG: hypothetical protein HQ523_00650 [Lentisphaerae bacterium]|nr:hypothetical protein [Lentisphaerota bacterium]
MGLVDNNPTGTVVQTGGSIVNAGGMNLAFAAGSVGEYTMSGGSLSTKKWVSIGSHGKGRLIQSGERVTFLPSPFRLDGSVRQA